MRKALEKDIQKQILLYLRTQKCFFWRQNSGNFSVKAREVLHKILRSMKISSSIASKITGAFYKAIGHYDCTSVKGLPDIIVIKDGRFIGIEVKTKTGRQSPSQKETQRLIEKNGGEYYIVRDVKEVKEILNGNKKEDNEKEVANEKNNSDDEKPF